MTGVRYRTDDPAARIAVPLDDLTALFHRPSGTTHLLASPAPELLDALAEGPADADTLLVRLQARFELPDGDAAAITARLAELEAAGLARRA